MWWIADGILAQGGKKLLGPFGSQELALQVRTHVEAAAPGPTYWVDEEPGDPGMTLHFEDADPVAVCATGDCQWSGHGDSINDAVTAWTAHLADKHRDDWPD